MRFRWLPGPARAIPLGLVAARDTGAVALRVSPYASATAGGDVALFALELPTVTMRVGFFGLIELEGSEPLSAGADGFGGLFPADALILWRGQYGGSLSVSLDWAARQWLPPGGRLEVTLSLRHESEHFTGGEGADASWWPGVANMGNFLIWDVAARVPIGPADLEIRLQMKSFLPRFGPAAYTYAPAVDLVLRLRLSPRAQPFFSVSYEHIFAGQRLPGGDLDLMRTLAGVLFPGRAGALQVFLALEVGHGKGLLASRSGLRFGGGLRITWPSGASIPR